MKAAPDAQLRLLDVQALDTRLDQLAHRRATLPEIAELRAVEERLGALRGDVVREETADSDLAREQTRIENEVEMVVNRATRDQQRLDAGQVSNPRELESLQHEIGSLGRRRADLEDGILEIMERREAVQSRLDGLRTERDRLAASRVELEQRLSTTMGEIDAEAIDTTTRRAAAVADVPDDLLALYEKIRASSGGVGAAPLLRGQCQGCRLTLPGSELAALRAAPPDDVLRCDECRRILVRTAESGLETAR